MCAWLPEASSAAARPEHVASYTLEARLDAVKHRVSGRGTIVIVNTARAPLSELYFHLYMNAFKNDATLFLRSPFGAGRSGSHGNAWGYIDVERLYARELESDLWPARAASMPFDPDDETNVRVPLPRALEPGQTLTLEVAFQVQLPEIIERTGYVDDYHFVAQWFPKLARLDPDGSFRHFAFHPQSEFAANFGNYDITLDVPEGDVVGASGVCAREGQSGGRRRLRCRAEDVHDFAWTAWSGFRERTERAGTVELRVLFPKGHEANAELALDSVRYGLGYFERRLGTYPYPSLTIVHPPDAGENSGGMEYPTLITTGGPWFTAYTPARGIETVALHELAHQWFYGLIGSDEHRHPFLDEGLTSYAEHAVLDARYGSGSSFDGFGLRISSDALSRVFSAARGRDEPIAQPAASFLSFRSLGAIVYSRTATLLRTLERVYGAEPLSHALSDYSARFRFAHPEPRDFVEAIRGRLGDDAARNLERALFERASVDYIVRDVRSAAAERRAGVFDEPTGRRTVPRSEEHPPPRYLSQAVVLRHGSLEFPIELELRFEDGRRELRTWDGRGTSHLIRHEGPSRLVGVTADPSFRILIDDDLMNNAEAAQAQGAPRVLERLAYVAELLLAGGLP